MGCDLPPLLFVVVVTFNPLCEHVATLGLVDADRNAPHLLRRRRGQVHHHAALVAHHLANVAKGAAAVAFLVPAWHAASVLFG